MATYISFQTVNEADIGTNAKATQAGVITFTEKYIYLGLGNDKKKKYGSTNAVAGDSGDSDPIDGRYIGSFDSDYKALISADATDGALFLNTTEKSFKTIISKADGNVEVITKLQAETDLTVITAELNKKANTTDVYTKTQTYSQTQIDNAVNAAKLDVTTTLSAQITAEQTRATTKENELQTNLNNRAQSVTYAGAISVKANDFVVHGNKIYLVKTPFTTTGNFTNDSVNLVDLAASMGGSGTLGVVEYAPGISIKNGQQVIYNSQLYICKADIANTTNWTTDKANMISASSSISLDNYYNKTETDALLANKMDTLTQGEGVSVSKVGSTITVSADMDKNATAEKLVQRDADGKAFAKNGSTLTDDELVNFKTFSSIKDQVTLNATNIAALQRNVDGTVNAYFNMPSQELVIGGAMIRKSFEFTTNVDVSEINITFDKADKICIDLENKEFYSHLAPVEADYPITAELTYLGQSLVKLTFNYSAVGAISSSSNFSLDRFKVYTLMLDMTKAAVDPTTCITLLDDAEDKTQDEIVEFLGFYPVSLSNGQEYQKLDPNNYKNTLSGVAATLALGIDVFVCFPRRGVKRWKEGSRLYMSITDDPNASGYSYASFMNGTKDNTEFYYGAYEGYVLNSKLYSVSGYTPAVNTTLTNFRKYAQARGTGYQLIDVGMVDYVQCCYLMVYQSLNSQKTVGMGRCSGGSVINTGGSDTWGLHSQNTASAIKTATTNNIKCLGIEDLWGNAWNWVDGLFIDNVYNICKSSDPSLFNDSGKGYVSKGKGINYGAGEVGYISEVCWDDERGFLPQSVQNGSDSTFFCDYLWQNASRCAIFGGSYGDGSTVGVFCWHLIHAASYSGADISSRLAYRK